MPAKESLTTYVERARKVLQYEQRANHQDKLVQGGLELFATRWAEECGTFCRASGLDVRPLQQFMGHVEDYRNQDPIQRATNIRAALAILDGMVQTSSMNGAANPTT